ncbi:hypothetical protein J6A31_04650 [bacterium]|nr:hypothetical protein [bacterium]
MANLFTTMQDVGAVLNEKVAERQSEINGVTDIANYGYGISQNQDIATLQDNWLSKYGAHVKDAIGNCVSTAMGVIKGDTSVPVLDRIRDVITDYADNLKSAFDKDNATPEVNSGSLAGMFNAASNMVTSDAVNEPSFNDILQQTAVGIGLVGALPGDFELKCGLAQPTFIDLTNDTEGNGPSTEESNEKPRSISDLFTQMATYKMKYDELQALGITDEELVNACVQNLRDQYLSVFGESADVIAGIIEKSDDIPGINNEPSVNEPSINDPGIQLPINNDPGFHIPGEPSVIPLPEIPGGLNPQPIPITDLPNGLPIYNTPNPSAAPYYPGIPGLTLYGNAEGAVYDVGNLSPTQNDPSLLVNQHGVNCRELPNIDTGSPDDGLTLDNL